ncbi:CRISPR-associated ring nuclease Crn3/Csx3 [Arthrospira platensis BEA 1257B]
MPQSAEPAIKLTLSQSRSVQGLSYQILSIELVTKDRLISPEDLRDQNLPAHIDYKGGIVISGRGPIWLYGYLIHELHPAAWVACYDPRLGAVVVATHSQPNSGRTGFIYRCTGKFTPAFVSSHDDCRHHLTAVNLSCPTHYSAPY